MILQLIFYSIFLLNVCNGQAYSVSTFAGLCSVNGNALGQGSQARFFNPVGIAVNYRTGVTYAAQYDNHCIVQISPAGIVSQLAGQCYPGYVGYLDWADPPNSLFNRPTGVAVHPLTEDVYVADFGNNCIRKIAIGSGQGEVSTYVGKCQYSGFQNGALTQAQFGMPHDLTFDSQNNLIVADAGNHCIRKVIPYGNGGSASTLAGSCTYSGFKDATGSLALFKLPRAVAVSSLNGQDIIYISDQENNCIRKYVNGAVSSFVGECNPNASPHSSYSSGQGSNALFYRPDGLDVDSNQNLIIVDRGNYCIRMASPGGVVTEFAGDCAYQISGFQDGRQDNGVRFKDPIGVSANKDGSVLITDSVNNCIRIINRCDPNALYNTTTSECYCRLGYQLNPTSQICVQCNLGTFRGSFDLSKCDQCPLGKESSADRTSCTKCASGKYRSSLFQNRCLDCPASSVCDTLGYNCLPGYRENSLQAICEQCPTGHYKNSTDNSDCTQCPLGFEVSDSYTTCKPCSIGTVRANLNSNTCLSTPANAVCSYSSCTCNNGLIYDTASNTCVSPTQSSPTSSTSNSIVQCTSGKYRAADGNTCVSCPSYASCFNSKFYCIAGYEYTSDRTECSLCPDLMFKSVTDASMCINCPEHATSCNQVGFVCKVGYGKNEQSTDCILDSSQSNQNSLVSTNTGIAVGLGFMTLIILAASGYLYKTRKQGYKNAVTVKRYIASSEIELSPIGSQSHLNPPRLVRSEFPDTHRTDTSDVNFTRTSQQQRTNLSATRKNRILLTPTRSTRDGNSTMMNMTVMRTAVAAYEQGLSIPGFLEFDAGVDFSWGKYLAEGGGGKIFTGKPLTDQLSKYGELIVIKQIAPPSSQRETDIFYQEISIMYMLREHLNIAKLVGYSTDPYAILMKFYPLGSLEKWLNSKSAKKTKTYLTLFIHDICEGLKFMHSNGLAHCDLKPPNCLLDTCENGDVVCVLTDFGITRIVNTDIIKIKQFRQIDVNGASMQYASPETIESFNRTESESSKHLHGPVKADIYSIGIIICRMLCRRLAWPRGGFKSDTLPSENTPIPPKRQPPELSVADNSISDIEGKNN